LRDGDHLSREIHAAPLKIEYLGLSHPGVQGKDNDVAEPIWRGIEEPFLFIGREPPVDLVVEALSCDPGHRIAIHPLPFSYGQIIGCGLPKLHPQTRI
jgi:hypothetical protein